MRLVLLLTAGLLIALPAAWISSQYFGNEVNATLSFHADDGWCNWGYTPDFGKHCFGDYVQPLVGAQVDFRLADVSADAIPGVTNPAYTSLYPPASQAPHVAAAIAANSFLGHDITFIAYMLLLAASVLAPALWVAWGWRESPFVLIPVLLLGVATVPVFATLDRGNSAGFVVPFLLCFAIFLGRTPTWVAPTAVVAAALVRPQFILIALALLAVRQWRQALAAVGAFGAVTLLSFALVPSGFAASSRAWLDSVSGLSSVGFGGVTSDTPANISVSRSVVALGGWLARGPSLIGDAGGWIQSTVVAHPSLPLAVLILVTGSLFLLAGGRLPRAIVLTIPLALAATASGIAPSYYLGFALVLAALIVGNRGSLRAALLDDGGREWWCEGWRWLTLLAIALSLTPLTFVGDTTSGAPIMRSSLVLENIGRLWLVVMVMGLAVTAARLIHDRAAQAPKGFER